MKFIGRTDELLEIGSKVNLDRTKLDLSDKELALIWFLEDDNEVEIDNQTYTLKKNQIICLTAFRNFKIVKSNSYQYLKFNSPFYCILDHDSEVGCKGILFYGASNAPIISPTEADIDILETVWKMLLIEMKSRDNLQLEMLQMMLKRILILCTRIYKGQEKYNVLEVAKVDVVREFNFLVETHFKTKHSVSEYASLLNKSPKTLSNLFKKLNKRTPLQIIRDRIILEVKSLLSYTDKPISEIGYDVGFSDIQSFSRFFKKYQGVSPSEFRAAWSD
jgi:AraC-like DNA-binding protein